jgi:hypothetical protein
VALIAYACWYPLEVNGGMCDVASSVSHDLNPFGPGAVKLSQVGSSAI